MIKTYETRVNWAVCHPRHKRELWQADYIGVTRLTLRAEKHWVNIYLSDGNPSRLRLRKKGGTAEVFSCRLDRGYFGRYCGKLLLKGKALGVLVQSDLRPKTGGHR